MGKGDDSRLTSEGDIERYKKLVPEMKDLNDFRNVAVTLITAAKCRTDAKNVSAQARAMSAALSTFKWSQLTDGTYFVSDVYFGHR